MITPLKIAFFSSKFAIFSLQEGILCRISHAMFKRGINMPAKPSGEVKTRIIQNVQKNGDIYILKRETMYDPVKKIQPDSINDTDI